jgi:long-chain fatty acid transport protein
MKPHLSIQPALAVTLVVAFAACPTPLLASGFQLVEQNGSGLGNAFAGQAASDEDASAIFFNPANITRIPGKQFVLGVNPIGINTRFTDGGSTRPLLGTVPIPVPAGTTGGDAGGWIPVPNGYFSWQASKEVWAGLGVGAPFGLKTEWDGDWMGRFKAIQSEVRTLNINPTVAVKVNDTFSIGAGADYQRLSATLSQGVAFGGISYGRAVQAAGPLGGAVVLGALGGPAGLAMEGTSTVDGDTWSWGWNMGAALNVGRGGHIGASFRSRIKHDIQGSVAFAGAPRFNLPGPLGPLGAGLNAAFASGPVTARIELPETVSVAASWKGEKAELMADYTRTGWTSIQTLAIVRSDGNPLSTVPLNFKDTWRAGLGFNYEIGDTWLLRLGTAYDQAPVQDQYRTPRLPDEDRFWAALGFQYKVGKKGAVDVGYAHLFVKDASSSLPNQDSATAPPSGNLVGNYKTSVNILSVQFRQAF